MKIEETRLNCEVVMGMHLGRPRACVVSSLEFETETDFFWHVMTAWGALSSAWKCLVRWMDEMDEL